jgi:hypothetical protein
MIVVASVLLALSACSAEQDEGRRVAASGKEDLALEALPEDVRSAALAASPGFSITAVEYETRDGNEYYDVGGTLADGSERELDITRIDGVWTVVEFQRDIGMDLVPEDVAAALAAGVPDWAPTRIIEADQGDGTIIYEFFGPGPGDELDKHEVKWTDGTAELLVDEWVH